MSAGQDNRVRYNDSETSSTANTGVLVAQSNHGFVVGSPVYHNGTIWTQAIADDDAIDNDTLATNVVTVVDSPNSFTVSITAIVAVNLGFTGSVPVFLSQSVNGSYTDVKPSTGIVQQLGWYENGNLYFNHEAASIGTNSENVTETDDYKLTRTITGNHITIVVKIKASKVVKIPPSTVAKTTVLDLVPSGNYNFFGLLSYYQSVDNTALKLGGNVTVSFNKLMQEGIPEIFALNPVEAQKGGFTVFMPATQTSRTTGSVNPSYYGSGKLPLIENEAITVTIEHTDETNLEYSFIIEGSIW